MATFIKIIIICLLLALLFGCTKPKINAADENTWTNFIVPTTTDLNLLTSHVDNYEYFLAGQKYIYKFTTYEGLNKYLNTFPNWYKCEGKCPSREKYVQIVVSEPQSQIQLKKITNDFNKLIFSEEDKVRALVSLVQYIDYNVNKINSNELYPYKVLFDNEGTTNEKVMLLLFLLKNMGYRTAYIYFPDLNHSAVGVGCDAKYDFRDSGYCYIETTSPLIITDTNIGIPISTSIFNAYLISTGIDFNAFDDSRAISKRTSYLTHIGDINFNYKELYNFNTYWGLNKKSCDNNLELCIGLCWNKCTTGTLKCDLNGVHCQ